MVRLGGLTGMTDTASNIIPWHLQMPAEITPDQLATAEGELHNLIKPGIMQSVAPLDDLSPEARDVFTAWVFHHGQSALEQIELRARKVMREAGMPEREIAKFKMATIGRSAKDLNKRLADQARRLAQRVRANQGKTDAGRPDQAAIDAMDLPEGAQIDALSGSMPLMAHAVLVRRFKDRLWYDEFYHALITDWDGSQSDAVVETRQVNEKWMLNAYFTLMREDAKLAKLSRTHADSAIAQFAFQKIGNAPREWIKSLKWDGVERLPTWLSTVYGTPQDEYHEAVGRNWIVGCAARIMDHGCKMDNMPVLIGDEGLYKSTTLEILGGKITNHGEHWYANLIVSADKTTDFLMTLNGTIISEVAELQALMNRKVEHAHVKNLLSTREDKYRAPYGRGPEPHKRTCVLCATTNEWHFNDFEGKARRFWPFEVTRHCDTEWLIANREQLFAEALARYQRGESWHVVPEAEHQAHIAEHRIDDPMVEWIEAWIRQRPMLYTGEECGIKPIEGDTTAQEYEAVWGNLITTNRLLAEVLKVDRVTAQSSAAKKLSSVMRNLGWDSGRVWVGLGEARHQVRAWVKRWQFQGQLFDNAQ